MAARKDRKYFEWLKSSLDSSDKLCRSIHYSKLLKKLFDTEFYSDNLMDTNREADALELREKFDIAWARNYHKPISVLEVMYALAYRLNDSLLWNPDYGDRTALWFWTMVDNLEFDIMDDDNYDDDFVEIRLDIILGRQYDEDGIGSLFPIPGWNRDARELDIWYQMQAFLQLNDIRE